MHFTSKPPQVDIAEQFLSNCTITNACWFRQSVKVLDGQLSEIQFPENSISPERIMRVFKSLNILFGLACASIVIVSGCSTTKPLSSLPVAKRIEHLRISQTVPEVSHLTTLDFSFSSEWEWNKTDKQAPPKLCVSFSGGGMRSATFSLGVLRSLQERGLLEEVDVISSVSGGSYAASALYAQYHHRFANFKPAPPRTLGAY